MNLAERWKLRPTGSNPCRGLEKFKERRVERWLGAEELTKLGDALTAYDGSPYAVAAIKLLAFTGARLGEVLGLRWEWIDFTRGEARLPDSKTGAKDAPPASPCPLGSRGTATDRGQPSCHLRLKDRCAVGQSGKALAGDPQGGRVGGYSAA